ncbi:E3 binding domain-containing protein, partial [Bacillus cereus group sp. BC326]|uniref:E3 binding domain-containing protein n=1 Tax=Bacillus cereus group sp. BC326 TaxID=3445310 RepID=UPI003F2382A7
LARRIAAEKGVDLASVQGSGPRGRIVKADVEGAKPGAAAAPAAAQAPASAPAPAPAAVTAPQGASAAQILKIYEGRETTEIALDGM